MLGNGPGATPDNEVSKETMKNSCRKEMFGTLKPKECEISIVSDIVLTVYLQRCS